MGSQGARERQKNTRVAGDSGWQWPGFRVVSGETPRGSEGLCDTEKLAPPVSPAQTEARAAPGRVSSEKAEDGAAWLPIFQPLHP